MVSIGSDLGNAMWDGPMRGGLKLIVPMFFALSGFLVSGSMERCKTLVSFLGLRVLRIYPALTVEVVVSALIFGPLVTTYSLGQYFSDEKFYTYLINITGHITYFLPGVFEQNPYPGAVNGQLWTVKWELACYAALAILIVFGLKSKKSIIWPALIAFSGLCLVYQLNKIGHIDVMPPKNHNFGTHVYDPTLVLYFLGGVALYIYRRKIAWSKKIFFSSLVFSYLAIGWAPAGDYISVIPCCYLTVYLGVCNPIRVKALVLSDYSYGIYLYGASVQQFVAFMIPSSRVWYLNLLYSLPLTTIIAMISWYLVEKPSLNWKSHLYTLETRWLSIREILKSSRA